MNNSDKITCTVDDTTYVRKEQSEDTTEFDACKGCAGENDDELCLWGLDKCYDDGYHIWIKEEK